MTDKNYYQIATNKFQRYTNNDFKGKFFLKYYQNKFQKVD